MDTFNLMLKKLGVLFILFCALGCSQRFDSKDNTFYSYVREQIHTLDPIHAHDLFSHQMTAQVYEGLYHFHYLKRPIEVEPLLASGMPEISKNGTVYTIPLKKNIYFHDSPAFKNSKGRLFVADDFIYTIKRLADPKNRSESFWVVENKIVGLDDWRKNGANEALDIPGIKALDPHTLQIQLTKPNYQFLQNLTMAAVYVVPREAVQFYGEEFGSHPVGTGPFVFESWIPGSQLRFAKNPNYNTNVYPSQGTSLDKQNGNLTDAGLRLPLVDRIVIYEISEPQPQWLLFSKGDLDLLLPHKDYQEAFIQNGKLKESQQKKGLALELPAGIDVVYIGLNNRNPFLRQKKVRQAFSLAFDRQFSIDKFYNFLAKPAHGPIPPGLDGYDESRRSAYSEYNIELAKQKLAEAGYPEGKGLPEFNYEMPSTHATARQASEFFKQQLSLLGVKVRLVANTWPQFNDKVKKNKADFFDYSWNADYPDPENFFQLFYSKNVSPGPNAAHFENKQFDLLYEKSLQLPAGDARTKLYIEMEKLIMEECPWIFNVHRLRPVLKHSWLRNYKHEVMIADTMKYYRIDSALRAKMKESNL